MFITPCVIVFLGNTLKAYIVSLFLLLALLAAIKVFRVVILNRLKQWARHTKTTLDDFLIELLQTMFLPAVYFAAFYISLRTLTLHPFLKRASNVLGMVVITVFIARLITAVTKYGMNTYWKKKEQDAAMERSLNGIIKVIQIVVWSLSVIFFLDNLGFKISAVIAGLGIGGVAVALAAQTILGDLFSYFAILFDRPFETGDFVVVGEFLGTIEHIGIKTTRIRSLSGEQVVFSNTDLTGSRVRNYKRMEKRRVVFKLGVTYETPAEHLRTIPQTIEKIIKNVPDTLFDRAHFSVFGDFSLIFEVVYYVLSNDYNKYMDIQQKINLAVKESFAAEKIEFAYPTQTLYLSKTNML